MTALHTGCPNYNGLAGNRTERAVAQLSGLLLEIQVRAPDVQRQHSWEAKGAVGSMALWWYPESVPRYQRAWPARPGCGEQRTRGVMRATRKGPVSGRHSMT